MILDLAKFSANERPFWSELEAFLTRLDHAPGERLTLAEVQRFHYLYERTSSDLARLSTQAAEPELRRYLEHLVVRAYGEIQETRRQADQWRNWMRLCFALPEAFRRHLNAFWLTVLITLAGTLFGALAVTFDPDAKDALLPEMFANHRNDPRERVAAEEGRGGEADRSTQLTSSPARMAAFSAFLMQNNIGVAIKTLAFGMTYGFGTFIVLLQNGVILGVVATDYVTAGETTFLLGWLLPHGVIEIPAILISGQAGFDLAHALIGWGRRERLGTRLRQIRGDLIILIAGVALLLVWAGVIEAFFSQFHEPTVPYSVKILFGLVEFILLFFYLFRGRARSGVAAS